MMSFNYYYQSPIINVLLVFY